MSDRNDEMEGATMRILLDLADENEEKQLEVLEVSDVYVSQEIGIIKNGIIAQEFHVPSCIKFTSKDEDCYYVIFECINTANSYVTSLFATGKLDLTNYRDSLLINPELDIEETKEILARLGIEV